MIRNLLFSLRWHKRLAKNRAELIHALGWSVGTVRMRGKVWRVEFHQNPHGNFFLIGEDR